MLAIDDLTVRYGPVTALREVSLTVAEGEIVTLLGANGAGKTSLLSAVAGLARVAGGGVAFEGAGLGGRPPEDVVRRGIALSPEGRRVFPRLTVRENLRLGGACVSDRDAAARTLDRVHTLFPVLHERAHQHAGTLSGGEQQMLAIGRALMSGPRLLMLDEPSLGLAPIIVERIFDLIARLRDEGMTILLVEQNAYRALQIADRGYVLVNGRIEAEGASEAMHASDEIRRAYLGAVA